MTSSTQKTKSAKVSQFIGLSAPVIVVGASSMYITSYCKNVVILSDTGLAADMFNPGIYNMMSTGGISLIFLGMIFISLTMSALFIGLCINYILGEKRSSYDDVIIAYYRNNPISLLDILRLLFYFLILLLIPIGGIGAGVWAGNLEKDRISKIISSKCSVNCFTYITESGSVTGIILISDDKHTAIQTIRGIKLIEIGKIRSIYPGHNEEE